MYWPSILYQEQLYKILWENIEWFSRNKVTQNTGKRKCAKFTPKQNPSALFWGFWPSKKCQVGPSKNSDKYIQFIRKPLKSHGHQFLVSTVLNFISLPNLVPPKLCTFKVYVSICPCSMALRYVIKHMLQWLQHIHVTIYIKCNLQSWELLRLLKFKISLHKISVTLKSLHKKI